MTIRANNMMGIDNPCVTIETELSSEDPGFPKRKCSFDYKNRATLSWRNIEVFVKSKGRTCSRLRKAEQGGEEQLKQLLHGVSGHVSPGTMLAIMGSSGAGKTTLLNVLTGKNLRGLRVEGQVLVNGRDLGKDLNRIAAYVQQDDLFIGELTVREHLVFQALLRMDEWKTRQERLDRVEEVMIEMGLLKCCSTKIGIPGAVKGISGGERKRLYFASEILTNPSLLFCDEPTSGLDSYMSLTLVQALRDMARAGRSIVFTIHQPSSELFEAFDHLLLLAEGKVAYQGEADRAIAFFSRAGLDCPINYNPADFFIYNLAVIPGKESECRPRIDTICAQHRREWQESKIDENESHSPEFKSMQVEQMKATPKYKASICLQFRTLFWRSWISSVRDKMLTKARFIQCVILALLFGLVYLQQKNDQKGVMNINGVIFLMFLNSNIRTTVSVVHAFCSERPLFMRENSSGMYRTSIFFLCKTLAEVPLLSAQSILASCISYWMIGLNNDFSAFVIFTVIMILTTNTAASFGYLVSCASPSIDVAILMGLPSLIPFILFSGYYLNNESIPVYLIWVKYISWFYYGNEALMINQWSSVTNITCDGAQDYCLSTGSMVLDSYSFKEDNLVLDIVMIPVLMISYRLLALFALMLRARQKT